jgi:predicted nucleotidyltransferase
VVGGLVVERKIVLRVQDLLKSLESSESVRVLLAVESGSRAWGFPSRDSDYDVRFIYIHQKEWYLSIDHDLRRDVIERPIEDSIDLNGWDIRKALRLFAKANPPLIEWLSSPVIYKQDTAFRSRLLELLPTYYEPRTCMYHYIHMAENNRRDYLEGSTVWVKKYLYVLRPVLAVRWIEQGRGPVPIAFDELFVTVKDNTALIEEIKSLIDRKKNGEELDRGPSIPIISNFIFQEMERQSKIVVEKEIEPPDLQPLQEVFIRWLDIVEDPTTTSSR